MNMKKFIIVIFTAVIGCVFVCDVPGVFAQGSDVDEFTLKEITVTAQKREENKQKVPIAMEVLSGDQLRELGNNDLDEILENISSIVVNKTGQNLRISLRGISDDQPEQSVQMSAPTVAVNTDGI
jgi:iron complex outermembrane receptor protein